MSENSISWKESTVFTKIGTICVGLAGLLGLIMGLRLAEDLADVLEEIAFGAIDFIVTFFLFKMHRWAREVGIYWGIVAFFYFILLEIVDIISFFSQYGLIVLLVVPIVPYTIQLAGSVCLLLAKNDFPKKIKP